MKNIEVALLVLISWHWLHRKPQDADQVVGHGAATNPQKENQWNAQMIVLGVAVASTNLLKAVVSTIII